MTDEPQPDHMKISDQIRLLEKCLIFTDTGEWQGIFTYPNCGADLVDCGLVTIDKKITTPGRALLFLIGKGPDPFPERKSFTEIKIPLSK